MVRKGLARYDSGPIERRQEWESFLGLLKVLALEPVERYLYERCCAAIGRLGPEHEFSRDELARTAGLDFHSRTLQFDVVLARLVKEAVITPVRPAPFRFRVQAAEEQGAMGENETSEP